jgi:pimeloyl-ACP methyl ester carboxylesterase
VRTAQAVAVLCLLSAAVGHAQFSATACMPDNSLQIQDQGAITLTPDVWAPGHTYTVTINGTYPISDDCVLSEVSVSAWQWPGYPNYLDTGAGATFITLSNLAWVNSTVTTFDVSVASDAPTGPIFLALRSTFGWDFWGVSIQPPAPPTPPAPPPPPTCQTPAFAPSSPVTPDTWIPGETYQITVKGTGFTTAADATSSCPTTQITISVDTGSVDLSNVVVVDSTTINATVTPADTDPGETAEVQLWGPQNSSDDVVRANAARVANATPMATSNFSISGMSQIAQTPASIHRLYIIDPFKSPFNGSTSIGQQAVISSLSNYSAVKANGLITDGAATAIVVSQSGSSASVIFSAPPGFTFTPWNGSFLNSPPSAGQNPSSPVQPIQIGSSYYSIALVQAPLQSASVDYGYYSTRLQAKLSSDSNAKYAAREAVTIAPTPIILVHGIWGTQTSLSQTQEDLGITAPWSGSYGNSSTSYPVLSPICYSSLFKFDETESGGSGCGQTSQAALKGAIDNIQQTIDQLQYVGGRVDLVAHSMGGLAVRHYIDYASSKSIYKTNRSRMQGLFRTVVTIDTPETGSLLATALMNPAISGGTCPHCGYFTLWHQACKTMTFEQCMAYHGQPLGAAVVSLEPGSTSILKSSLPYPNAIPNVNWFAIGSDWTDNVGGRQSELRTYFNTLLSQMSFSSVPPGFTCTSLPPSLSCILEDSNNDVIVTRTSQLTGVPVDHTAQFSNLAHTSMPLGAGLVVPGSNRSVLDGSVDGCVQQILLTSSVSGSGCPAGANSSPHLAATGQKAAIVQQSTTAPTPEVAEAEQEVEGPQQSEPDQLAFTGETDADAAQRALVPMTEEDQRMSVKAPDGDIPLGNPVQLTISLAPGKISAPLAYVQSTQSKDFDGGLARIVQEDAFQKTIEIVPLKLGPVDVLIQTVYSDNALVRQTTRLNVVPSSTGLKTFRLNQGFSAMRLVLDDDQTDRQKWLFPMVTYEGLKFPIYLDDSSQVKLSIEQNEGNPVISVDKNGMVHAIREGTAVLLGEFAGVTDKIQVSVETN